MLTLCSLSHGPREHLWEDRLVEEFEALIGYVTALQESKADWFQLEANDTGTHWTGMCWIVHREERHEFVVELELPPHYPFVPPSVKLPELEGKTTKMYKGGYICLDEHFAPLWQKNVPYFGIVHTLHHGLLPWLQVEVAFLHQS